MSVRILTGDARAVLKTLPDASVQCCVTSPPYYGLRDYGTAQWEGGDAGCDHARPSTKVGAATTLRMDGREHLGLYDAEKAAVPGYPYRDICGKCGARRIDAQIGLEQTTDEYVDKLVEVFREVRRVLRDDGTCWINLGDSYSSMGTARGLPYQRRSPVRSAGWEGTKLAKRKLGRELVPPKDNSGEKPKDLLGIPWMVAFALRADGWWLRSDIIWAKPSPMPESVQGSHFSRHMITIEEYERLSGLPYSAECAMQFEEERQADPSRLVECPGCEKCAQHNGYTFHLSAGRPTSAHEHVFLLSKRASYFWDADAVREQREPDSLRRSELYGKNPSNAKLNDDRNDGGRGGSMGFGGNPDGRNIRNVWTIATRPEGISHFALMPPDLASICVRAGTSERGQCPHCGSPWARVTGKGEPDRDWQRRCGSDANGEYHGASTKGHAAAGVQDASAVKARILAGMAPTLTLGWQPTCTCPAHTPVPQTVLDCFGGAGTTGLVADRLGRNAVLIELNPAYSAMARDRIIADCPLFAEAAD